MDVLLGQGGGGWWMEGEPPTRYDASTLSLTCCFVVV